MSFTTLRVPDEREKGPINPEVQFMTREVQQYLSTEKVSAALSWNVASRTTDPMTLLVIAGQRWELALAARGAALQDGWGAGNTEKWSVANISDPGRPGLGDKYGVRKRLG